MESRGAVLVLGASGVVGRAALETFAEAGMRVYGASRRPPDTGAGVHLPIDLTDREQTVARLRALEPVTHVVYAALFEQPGLLAGWVDETQMATNRAMLAHCLEGLEDHPVTHLSLLQGTKAYGAHVMPMRIPGRERDPRVEHPNFYWLQEDLLREHAAARGYAFTIWRPPVIFGHALGAPMNVLAALGVHAAICRELDRDFGFPGGASGPLDGVDARLLARAFRWAMDAPTAAGATFNVTNGDVFRWPDLWDGLADAFGVRPGPPEPRSLADFLPRHATVWDRVRERERLRAPALDAFVGDSMIYADMLLAHGRTTPPPPTLLSTIAVRHAGFADCIDTEEMMRQWIARLQEERILPSRAPATHVPA